MASSSEQSRTPLDAFREDMEGDSIQPPKAIIRLAARGVLGRPSVPSDFSGGEESTCNRTLEDLCFEIRRKELAHSEPVPPTGP